MPSAVTKLPFTRGKQNTTGSLLIYKIVFKQMCKKVKVVVSHGEECRHLSVQENQIISELVEDLFSNQEEADTRLLLHTKNATDEGHSKIITKSSDVDVEVPFYPTC